MPEISRSYGIVMKMYFGDHHPPHFHSEYGEFEVAVPPPHPHPHDKKATKQE